MANKRNIRSIRFSDELAEVIEQQQGQNFTEKFENLVTRCILELPAREKELAELEERIEEKRRQYQKMSAQSRTLRVTINEIVTKAYDLENAIDRAVKRWEM